MLILNIFAFLKDVEDGERREVGDFAEFIQNLRNIVFSSEFRFHKIFQGVDPEIDLIVSMLFA
jgi:hypothetical protein